MFQHDIIDLRDEKRRIDKQRAFETWRDKNLPDDGKSLQFKNGETSPFKGKKHQFLVASFGDYMGSDGRARRFVSYRAAVVNHTIVYTWVWDGEKWLAATEQQFIQF